ncbi:MAG: hypothetical protein ACRDNS_18620, partial [Trebonia sp.]
MALGLDDLLAVHERLWKQRLQVLERWEAAWARREAAERALARRRRSAEVEMVRASGGLSARQRAWAAAHSDYASRPRDRAGRQVLVQWVYGRRRIDATAAKWTAALASAGTTVTDAGVALAAATDELLEAWG